MANVKDKMTVTYLGTAAAEGLPAVFCNCKACLHAKEKGGKEIRTRSQILVDACMLIDFPMDSYMHMLNQKLDLSAIKDVFITHAHMDHCYTQDFTMRTAPYAHDMAVPTLNIFGNPTVIDRFYANNDSKNMEKITDTVRLNVIHPFDEIGRGEIEVIALPAKHTAQEECLVYCVSKNGKSALILNDTGRLSADVFLPLKKKGITLDLVSYDCTYGWMEKGEGRHMGALDAVYQRGILQEMGLLSPDSKHVLTHFSHNGALPHDEMAKIAETAGFIIAFDGMQIVI